MIDPSGESGRALLTPSSWSAFLDADAPQASMPPLREAPSRRFLGHIHALAAAVIASPGYHDPETGYISDGAWKRLVDGGVLAPFLQHRRAAERQAEIMTITRILSFHDTHLGLTCGIVGALAVVPIQMFGSDAQQAELLGMIEHGHRIGLAITPTTSSGTAALTMGDRYEVVDGRVCVRFDKHFQGLSGKSGLIVASLVGDSAVRGTSLTFVPQDHIETELFETIGLTGIPYGVNKGDVDLDARAHLLDELKGGEGLRAFQDIFVKSRLGFVGMRLGQLERLEMEARAFASRRRIGATALADLPVVARSLRDMSAMRVVLESLFERGVASDGFNTNTGDLLSQAAIIKALSAEYALKVAAARATLAGALAYHRGGALQDFVDAWPFTIFEGPEPFMYSDEIPRVLQQHVTDEGETCPRFGKEGAYSDLLDFAERSIFKRRLFDASAIESNLEAATKASLREIKPNEGMPDTNELIGQIVARLFALGGRTLGQEPVDRDDDVARSDAISLLNSEIRMRVDEYRRRQARPL